MIRLFGTWNYCRYVGINTRRRWMGLKPRSQEDLTILPVPNLTSLDAREGKPKNAAKPLPEMAVEKDSKDGNEFYHVCRIVSSDIPHVLREIFKDKVKHCHGYDFSDGEASGNWLMEGKNGQWTANLTSEELDMLKRGNTYEWNLHLLFHCLLHSKLCLLADRVTTCKAKIEPGSQRLKHVKTDTLQPNATVLLDLGDRKAQCVICKVTQEYVEVKWDDKSPEGALNADMYVCSQEWHTVNTLYHLCKDVCMNSSISGIPPEDLTEFVHGVQDAYRKLGVLGISNIHNILQEEPASTEVTQCYEELFKREFAAVPETVLEDNIVTNSEDHYFTINDLKELLNHPLHDANWRFLGEELGLENHELDTIQANNANFPDFSRCCVRSVFSDWLRFDGTASCKKLVSALAIAGMTEAAEELCMQYGITTETLPLPRWIATYREYLRENYCKMPIFPCSIRDWFPYMGRELEYMHVALIQEDVHVTTTEMAEFYSRNSLLGKIDRIIAKKTELKLKDMFEPLDDHSDKGSNQGMRILVDGAPGVGKTTLGRKISKDWAEEKILKEFDLVMLLELRKQQFAKATSLKHIFPHAYDEKLQQQVVDHVSRSEGNKLLVIFDGFDELTDPSENLLLLKLIKQELLPKCTVMVTSRQYASKRLHDLQCVDRHFEVLGFTEEEIQNCIRAGIADESKAAALIEHLSQRQDISCLCYIPLVCSMVIYVYMEMNFTLPSSLTELFHQLVLIAAKRQGKLRYDRPVLTADDLKTLPQPTYNELDILCEMAFKNLEEDKAIFYSEDLESLPYGCRDIESHTLGLVTAVKSYPILEEQLNYQFLHLTIQEFLSAKWIVDHLPLSEQGAYFKEKQQDDRFRLVLVFLAGLSGLKSEHFHDVFTNVVDFTNKIDFRYLGPNLQQKNLSCKKENENNYHVEAQRFLLLLLFLHEAKNETLCTALSAAVAHQIIDLHNARFTLFHCRALGYFLSRSHCSWKALHLPVHGLDDRSIEVFHDSCSGTTTSSVTELTVGQISHHLPISTNDFTQQGARLLCSMPMIRQCESITCIYTHSTSNGPDAIPKFLSLPNTKTLCISSKFNQNTHLQTPLYFEKHLQSHLTLQVLHLCECGVDCTMSKMLANALRENATVKELSLRANQMRGAGARALFEALQVNCSLRSLDLTCNPELTKMSLCSTGPVINSTLEALEEMITVNTSLQTLNVDDCGLSGTAVESVARGLTYNKGLETLSISVYFDPKSGLIRGSPQTVGILAATNVFKSLQVNKCLKTLLLAFRFDLDLQCTDVLSHSIEEMFSMNKSLQVFELHLLPREHGVINNTYLACFEQSLASGLKQNSSIKELSFTGQFFVPTACQMLFNSLTHHPSLAKLSIDMAYNNDSVKALADMLSSNSTLQYLNLCSLLVFMRKTFAPKIFKGIEIPDSMKTDRGVPDMQSQSDNLVQFFHDVYPGLPEVLKRFRDTLPDTDPGENCPDPLVLTDPAWSFCRQSRNWAKEFPLVDPRNAMPASACIQIFKSLEQNYTLRKIHLPVETFNTFHRFFNEFSDVVSNNPTLASVMLHSNDQFPSMEWLEVFSKKLASVRPQLKRFGRGTVGFNFVKCGLKFERNYTELYSQPAT